MKRFAFSLVLAGMTLAAVAQTSPNGKIAAKAVDGGLTFSYDGQPVLRLAELGYDGSVNSLSLSFRRQLNEDYTMQSGKRLHCTNEANEYVAVLGGDVSLVLRLYNDGVALRYEGEGVTGRQERTAWQISADTRRWMQRWTEAYEGFYNLAPDPSQRAGEEGHAKLRWGFPALIEAKAAALDGTGAAYVLLSEANIERGQAAACLYSEGDRYRVVAESNTLQHTPWRVAVIGSLADVVASTLVTDVCEPCRLDDVSWIQPGVVAWVYWAYNHGSNDYNIIRKYVDLAVSLHLPYVLIDAEWDEMKDGKTVEDAIAYAREKAIKPMIWYNSSVGWINGAPGPKFRLNKPEDREREFAWCERLGVAGVKIDFFSGDTQLNMDYSIDLLESAARHHLLVNFHGATIPRGWQRTYPNLMSTEGVYGAEWYNNVPTFTDKAARHNATLPFTRNVIGPMDYTPCAFSDSQHPHITTHAHELALTVLYESGLQHLADRPESFLAQPQAVQDFFGRLPAAWDETRYVSGYPGQSVVLARRSGSTWYVAGINGTDEPLVLATPLDFVGTPKQALLFADSGDSQSPWAISTPGALPAMVKCQPRGGFVCVINN